LHAKAQLSPIDLTEELAARSAGGAAAKLARAPAEEIASLLMRLSPGFAQDVLGALPDDHPGGFEIGRSGTRSRHTWHDAPRAGAKGIEVR
jgi:hypothetical protein